MRLLAAAYEPRGDLLACGASDGAVLLFAPRAAGGRQQAVLRWAAGFGEPVAHLVWASEGVIMAAGYASEGVAAWDLRRRMPEAETGGPADEAVEQQTEPKEGSEGGAAAADPRSKRRRSR